MPNRRYNYRPSQPNGWAILPAAKCLFDVNKVTLEQIAGEWKKGAIVVCRKDNGKLHFIAGAGGSLYAPIGSEREVFHDQTLARIGRWTVVNQIEYSTDDKGKTTFKYAVDPMDGENMIAKAGLHVFK